MIQAMVVKAVVKLIAKQFKLDKILDYVENPNDADKRIDELELDVFTLKQQAKKIGKHIGNLCWQRPLEQVYNQQYHCGWLIVQE